MKVMLCTNINQEMSSVLKPKCIPVDNTNDALQMSQCLGHSAEGFLLPCCWIDSGWNLRDEVQNIKEITQSKEWTDFYTMLQERPEDAPRVCKKYCSENFTVDKYGEK